MTTSKWRPKEYQYLKHSEFDKVMADLDRKAKRSISSRENRVVFVLATCCGLRASEIGALDLEDVALEMDDPLIILPAGKVKGKKNGRTIPLAALPEALSVIAAWKKERRAMGAKKTSPFVCTLATPSKTKHVRTFRGPANQWDGKPFKGHPKGKVIGYSTIQREVIQCRKTHARLTRIAIRSRFKSCLKVLGEERQSMLTVHDGRHTCASFLIEAGWPLSAVQDMLGHANVATTSIYTHRVPDARQLPRAFTRGIANGKAKTNGDAA